MPARENPPTPDAGLSRLTVFHDPASDESRIVLATLKAAGQDPRLVDYMATPPDREALKNLSLLLRGGDQSLVRKYDPLFLELRLDDRFISDGEFWAAIVEHPSLINGPVIATAQKARVCRTENAVKAFLGIEQSAESPATAKPKGIPARMAPASTDAAVPKPAVKEQEVGKADTMSPEKLRAQAPAPQKAKTETKAKVNTEIQPQARTALKAAPKTKAAPKAAAKAVKAVKAAKPVKKAAAKPVKKAKRAPKR
ncbi:MAG: ArsC/Spx/MgsR family protein [Rhizomicrobium sp.]